MLRLIKSALRKHPRLYAMAQFLVLNTELLPRRFSHALKHRHQRLTPQEIDVLARLKRDGIVVLPGFLSPEQVSTMRNSISQAIDNQQFYAVPGEFAYNLPQINLENVGRLNVIDPTICNPEFIKFSLNPLIRRVIDHYLGINTLLSGIAAYRTKPTLNHPKGAFSWHYDNAYLQVKAIAYLTDVTENNGPFAYIPKTLKRRLVTIDYAETRVADDEVPIGSYVNCVGSAGTVLLVDTQIIHRATPNLSGHRDVVSIVYDAAPRTRRRCFYNLPIPTPNLLGLTPEQRRFLRAPENPGQVG